MRNTLLTFALLSFVAGTANAQYRTYSSTRHTYSSSSQTRTVYGPGGVQTHTQQSSNAQTTSTNGTNSPYGRTHSTTTREQNHSSETSQSSGPYGGYRENREQRSEFQTTAQNTQRYQNQGRLPYKPNRGGVCDLGPVPPRNSAPRGLKPIVRKVPMTVFTSDGRSHQVMVDREYVPAQEDISTPNGPRRVQVYKPIGGNRGPQGYHP